MTSIYELEPEILKLYVYTKIELSISRYSKLRAQTRFLLLDLDLTLTYELDLKILKMYQHTKSELFMSRFSKVGSLHADTQTHATERVSKPHSRVVTGNIIRPSTVNIA